MGEYKVTGNPEEDQSLKELPGYTIFSCMMAVLKVLLNITHERSKYLRDKMHILLTKQKY